MHGKVFIDVPRRYSPAESGERELLVPSCLFYAIWEYSVGFSSDHRTGFFSILLLKPSRVE